MTSQGNNDYDTTSTNDATSDVIMMHDNEHKTTATQKPEPNSPKFQSVMMKQQPYNDMKFHGHPFYKNTISDDTQTVTTMASTVVSSTSTFSSSSSYERTIWNDPNVSSVERDLKGRGMMILSEQPQWDSPMFQIEKQLCIKAIPMFYMMESNTTTVSFPKSNLSVIVRDVIRVLYKLSLSIHFHNGATSYNMHYDDHDDTNDSSSSFIYDTAYIRCISMMDQIQFHILFWENHKHKNEYMIEMKHISGDTMVYIQNQYISTIQKIVQHVVNHITTTSDTSSSNSSSHTSTTTTKVPSPSLIYDTITPVDPLHWEMPSSSNMEQEEYVLSSLFHRCYYNTPPAIPAATTTTTTIGGNRVNSNSYQNQTIVMNILQNVSSFFMGDVDGTNTTSKYQRCYFDSIPDGLNLLFNGTNPNISGYAIASLLSQKLLLGLSLPPASDNTNHPTTIISNVSMIVLSLAFGQCWPQSIGIMKDIQLNDDGMMQLYSYKALQIIGQAMNFIHNYDDMEQFVIHQHLLYVTNNPREAKTIVSSKFDFVNYYIHSINQYVQSMYQNHNIVHIIYFMIHILGKICTVMPDIVTMIRHLNPDHSDSNLGEQTTIPPSQYYMEHILPTLHNIRTIGTSRHIALERACDRLLLVLSN